MCDINQLVSTRYNGAWWDIKVYCGNFGGVQFCTFMFLPFWSIYPAARLKLISVLRHESGTCTSSVTSLLTLTLTWFMKAEHRTSHLLHREKDRFKHSDVAETVSNLRFPLPGHHLSQEVVRPQQFQSWKIVTWLFLAFHHMGVSITWGYPKNAGWFIRENSSINGWWLGVPLFEEIFISSWTGGDRITMVSLGWFMGAISVGSMTTECQWITIIIKESQHIWCVWITIICSHVIWLFMTIHDFKKSWAIWTSHEQPTNIPRLINPYQIPLVIFIGRMWFGITINPCWWNMKIDGESHESPLNPIKSP